MRTDIPIDGKHAEIIEKFSESKFFTGQRGTNELFYLAYFIGLFDGEISEMSAGEKRILISRYWLTSPKRAEFKHLVNTFANLESKYNGMPLSNKQIFLDEEQTDSPEKIQQIKNYGYAGLEKLYDKYFVENEFEDELDVINFIEDSLLTKEELDNIEIKTSPATFDVDLKIDELLESD